MPARLLAVMVLALLAWLPVTAVPAAAGLGDVAARLGLGPAAASDGLEAAAGAMRGAPVEAERTALAVAGSDVGHWRLVNRAGEPFTAADGTELARALRTLAPEADSEGQRLTLYLAEDMVFRHPAMLEALPAKARLLVVLGEEARPVLRAGSGKGRRIHVEVRPRLLIEAGERSLFAATLAGLDRPLARSRIRAIALEPGGPTAVPRAPRVDPKTRRALPDAIDPGHLDPGLGALRGQTVVVTGRIDGDRLLFKPAAGPESNIALADLLRAAAGADLNLVLLGTTSSRQPGTRNWLWQTVEVASLERAAERPSLGGFLIALAGEAAVVLVRPERQADGRLLLELRPRAVGGDGPVGTLTEAVAGTWSDIVSETAGRLSVGSVRASLVAASRQAELDRRLLPGIPSLLQLGYIGVLVLGLLALPTVAGWWRRIWPPELAAEYANRAGYHAARLVRALVFVALFLPLAALPAVAARIAGLAAGLRRPAASAPGPGPGQQGA
jgi:hypothetical protein